MGALILFIVLWAGFGLVGYYLWDLELRESDIKKLLRRRDLILLPIFFILTGVAGLLLALVKPVTDFIRYR